MDIGTFPLLSVIIFLPLIGSLVVAILPASSARPVALGFALATFLLSLFLLIGYLRGRINTAPIRARRHEHPPPFHGRKIWRIKGIAVFRYKDAMGDAARNKHRSADR